MKKLLFVFPLVPPLHFWAIDTKCEDFLDAGILRAMIYSDELNSFEKDQFITKEGEILPEIDKYDCRSIHLVAIKGLFAKKKVVGTARLILDKDSVGYLMEKGYESDKAFLFNIPLEIDRSQTAELSRLCVRKDYRGKAIGLGLLRAAYKASVDHDINTWVAAVNIKLLILYVKLGINFEVIGKPQEYHGILTVPIKVELSKTGDDLIILNPKLALLLLPTFQVLIKSFKRFFVSRKQVNAANDRLQKNRHFLRLAYKKSANDQ